MVSHAKLLSIGFSVPDQFVLTQDQVLERLGYTSPLSRRIFHNTGIEKRHFVVDPLGLSWQELRELSRPLGLALSMKAVRSCLDGKYTGKDLGCLVYCSVSDYNTPALGYYIGRELCVRDDIEFVNLQGQGCQSALPGLKRAYEYFQANRRPAMVLNCEIGSTTFFPSDESDLENVVTNSLFADSATAVLVGEDNDDHHPFILGFQSLYDPRYLDILGYTWVDGRLKCRLDRSVPEVIPPLFAEAVHRLLAKHELTLGDIRHWALHPGGPAILRKIEELLGLSEAETWASWETLRNFGNCSSATLAMIGKRVQETITDYEGYGVGVTMGAGGSIEAMCCSWGEP